MRAQVPSKHIQCIRIARLYVIHLLLAGQSNLKAQLFKRSIRGITDASEGIRKKLRGITEMVLYLILKLADIGIYLLCIRRL